MIERLLEGKQALVTGGSRGIGKAVVETYLKAGADVIYVSTKESPHHAELKEIAGASKTTLSFIPADLGKKDSVNACLDQVEKDFGHVHILVNNAGITRDALLIGMRDEYWEEVLQVNLSSPFLFCKRLGHKMASKRDGVIINMSSIAGIVGNQGQSNYSASKAGLIGFTKTIARELSPRSVRVNVIAPGLIETDMTNVLGEKILNGFLSQIALKRPGKSEEIAQVALFLASDMSSYITGQVIVVDGGMIA